MNSTSSLSLVDRHCAADEPAYAGCVRNHRAGASQRGFTLVEIIIVIVITSIIGVMVAVFIRAPVQGYFDTVARAELTDVADTALRRLARDLRLALPNSIRVTTVGGTSYLEFLLTKTGGRYLAEDDGQPGNPLLFGTAVNCAATPTDCKFDVVGPMPSGEQAILSGDYIVVYNLGVGQEPANAYDCTGNCNRATVSGAPAGNTITLASNPFAAQSPNSMESPTRRFQVVTTPVTYVCVNGAAGSGTLTRYWGYPIQKDQPTDTGAAPLSGAANALLASNVTSCGFSYSSLANTHSALVGLNISLEIPSSSSGKVNLVRQVHVDNTP